ncbi:hypothetical protein [Blastochloris tepida]|uniref:Uncharacterized protein n=1 Tax=Blastochloris tepida TaxID=2233851 RepID=A0A348FYK9_9HYPH|nr:hypothetical protein [Blastochloris tepida]BBF92392.1 hypothetical protein BLTE_10770 [Blastochloris tepida]
MARFTREQIEAEIAAIDWSQIDRPTDAEIEAAVAADPDAAPIRSTEEWLASADLVLPPKAREEFFAAHRAEVADLQAKLDAAHAALRELHVPELRCRLLDIAKMAEPLGLAWVAAAVAGIASTLDGWMRRHAATYLAARDAAGQPGGRS